MPFAPPLVFAAAFTLVTTTHPEGFGGWGLFALSPVAAYALYLLVFRTPPRRLRVAAASAVVGGYGLVFGLVAGLGDESYSDVGRIVYLGLPVLGGVGLLGCFVFVEAAGAVVALRQGWNRAEVGAPPPRPLLAALGVAVCIWTLISLAGWTGPRVVVAGAAPGPPPAIAAVRCDGRTTNLLTPSVLAGGGGIRVRVDNRGSSDAWIEYEVDGGLGGGGGAQIPHGVSEHLIRFSASSVGIACLDGPGGAGRYATMEVVEPGPQ